MAFDKLTIKPNKRRAPFFDGGEEDRSAFVAVPCRSCSGVVPVLFWSFVSEFSDWHRDEDREFVDRVMQLFTLPSKAIGDIVFPKGHSLANPVVGKVDCGECGAQLLVCISHEEVSPMHYRAVLEAVAQ